ncbi:transcriptional regulator [Leifsonia sp. Root4]|uniref:GAF and ANTAR domain-containing protein n=1 Tax=Leifsonia sp. Root4 TaxID=1736525 RepID=UPI0006F3C697|nr:GAF and ANTAR domain-containing protein [Leifsonia sp. Root4]KQW06580.1 transcriptional regulator [Leifsonia sp. Root4]
MTPSITRDQELFEIFVALADTLVDEYDVVELLQTLVDSCVSLFDVAAAGLLLVDDTDALDLVASTSEESRLVELMQLSAEDGPCIECFRTSATVSIADIRESPAEWARFRAAAAAEQGFGSVTALPMRLRSTTIGTLNLFRAGLGDLNARDIRAAQAMADVATIGILHERTVRAGNETRDQLQHALNSRVTIEQAKGVIAFTHTVSMDEAFARLRDYARANRMPLAVVAAQLVARELII